METSLSEECLESQRAEIWAVMIVLSTVFALHETNNSALDGSILYFPQTLYIINKRIMRESPVKGSLRECLPSFSKEINLGMSAPSLM